MNRLLIILMVGFSCLQCKKQDFSFTTVWEENPELGKVAMDTAQYKVQILLTDLSSQKEYSYNLKPNEYFYPASMVQLPTAIVALERIYEEGRFKSTDSILLENDSIKTTVRQEVNKIFGVGDNSAFNRLLWLTGNKEINACMNLAEGQTQIQHSLESHDTTAPGFYKLFSQGDTLNIPTQRMQQQNPILQNIHSYQKGNAHFYADTLRNSPMDFSKKNMYSLRSMHQTLVRLYAPEMVSESQRFQLSESDETFLKSTMAKTPSQLGWDSKEFSDIHLKFFVVGDQKKSIPKHLKIHNTAGFAYGQITDAAYIIDTKSGKKFILSATLYVNKNQILNDNLYEYETIGIPFLAQLGSAILAEL